MKWSKLAVLDQKSKFGHDVDYGGTTIWKPERPARRVTQFDTSTDPIGAVLTKKWSKFDNFGWIIQIYGRWWLNFEPVMQISSAGRTTQLESLTNSVGSVLDEMRLIPSPGGLWGHAGHLKKIAQRSWSEKYGTNGSFLRKTDTALPFLIVSQLSNGDSPMKLVWLSWVVIITGYVSLLCASSMMHRVLHICRLQYFARA